MACQKSLAFYGLLLVGLPVLGLFIFGYSTPGWVVLCRKFTIEEFQVKTEMVITETMKLMVVDDDSSESDMDGRQRIDDGGIVPDEDDMPQPDEDHHRRPGHHGRPRPPHRRGSHHQHAVIEETTQMQEWVKSSMVEVGHVYLKLKYGLWQSRICMSSKMEHLQNEDETEIDDKHDSSSSSSEEGHKRKGCHCKKISTKCALMMSIYFIDPEEIMVMEMENSHFNPKNFLGNTCLLEHQLETSFGLVLLAVAIIVGVVGFRKIKPVYALGVTCLICLLCAFVMISIPTLRIVHYNLRHVKGYMTNSRLHVSFSWAAMLVTAIVIPCLALLVGVALCRVKKTSGQWNRFENDDTDSLSEKKKGFPGSLVFVPEPLTGKAGLYDIWGDVKPVEVVEPEEEKKPIE